MDMRRQANDSGMADVPPASHRSMGASNGGMGGSMMAKILVVLLIILSVVVLGWFLTKTWSTVASSQAVKDKQYQAVFLTNGQVYFGKFGNVNSSYVKLTNIYYLQVQQAVQPKDQSSS